MAKSSPSVRLFIVVLAATAATIVGWFLIVRPGNLNPAGSEAIRATRLRELEQAEQRDAARHAQEARLAVSAIDRQPNPPKGLLDGVGQLGLLRPEPTNLIVADLISQGEVAVTKIRHQLQETPHVPGQLHPMVRVLKGVGSEQACDLLTRIALGEMGGNPNDHGWAATSLMEIQPESAGKLLASPSQQVLIPALTLVANQPVDEVRFALLKTMLMGRDAVVSWRASDILARGTRGDQATEAVDAMIAAITDVSSREDADQPYLSSGATCFEASCAVYIESLVKTHVDNQTIHDRMLPSDGRTRRALLVVLGRRGDVSVHDELVQIGEDPDAALFRAWTARAFRQIGTTADLPLLRKLANEDPLVREGLLGNSHAIGAKGPTYPVRDEAAAAIRVIEKKHSS